MTRTIIYRGAPVVVRDNETDTQAVQRFLDALAKHSATQAAGAAMPSPPSTDLYAELG